MDPQSLQKLPPLSSSSVLYHHYTEVQIPNNDQSGPELLHAGQGPFSGQDTGRSPIPITPPHFRQGGPGRAPHPHPSLPLLFLPGFGWRICPRSAPASKAGQLPLLQVRSGCGGLSPVHPGPAPLPSAAQRTFPSGCYWDRKAGWAGGWGAVKGEVNGATTGNSGSVQETLGGF